MIQGFIETGVKDRSHSGRSKFASNEKSTDILQNIIETFNMSTLGMRSERRCLRYLAQIAIHENTDSANKRNHDVITMRYWRYSFQSNGCVSMVSIFMLREHLELCVITYSLQITGCLWFLKTNE